MGDKEVRICNCLFEPDLNQALISYGITIMLPYYGYDKSVNDDISHPPCQLPTWWADCGDQELGGLQCLPQFTLEELACVIPRLYYGRLIPISNHQLGLRQYHGILAIENQDRTHIVLECAQSTPLQVHEVIIRPCTLYRAD